MKVDETAAARVDALIQKAHHVLGTERSTSSGGVVVDYASYLGWRGQTHAALVSLFGTEHPYVSAFVDGVHPARNLPSYVKVGIAILTSVLEDIRSGYFREIETLISAEVFTDFLHMAEHLLETGYKDPAAMLTGAVLEDGLKRMAANRSIPLKAADDLSSLNAKCADASVYNRLRQKEIQFWTDIRNKAAHGQFTEYKGDDVQKMHRGVTAFLAQYLE